MNEKTPAGLAGVSGCVASLVASAARRPSIPPSKKDDEAENREEYERAGRTDPQRGGHLRLAARAACLTHWCDRSSRVKCSLWECSLWERSCGRRQKCLHSHLMATNADEKLQGRLSVADAAAMRLFSQREAQRRRRSQEVGGLPLR